jgi:hypothetical protein
MTTSRVPAALIPLMMRGPGSALTALDAAEAGVIS